MSAQQKLNEAQRLQDLQILQGLIDDQNAKCDRRDRLRTEVETLKKKVKDAQSSLDTTEDEIEKIQLHIRKIETLDLFATPAVTGVPKEAFDQPQPATEAMAAAQASKNNAPITFSFAPAETDTPDDGPFNNKELIIFVRGEEERHVSSEQVEQKLIGKGPDGYINMDALYDASLEALKALSDQQREEFFLTVPIHYEISLVIPDEDQESDIDAVAIFTKGPETRYLTEELLTKLATEGISPEELENLDEGDLGLQYLSKLPFYSQNQLEAVWQQLPSPQVAEEVNSFFQPTEAQPAPTNEYLTGKFTITHLQDGRVKMTYKKEEKYLKAEKVADIEESYDCTFEDVPESALETLWEKVAKPLKQSKKNKSDQPAIAEEVREVSFMHAPEEKKVILRSDKDLKFISFATADKIEKGDGLILGDLNGKDITVQGQLTSLSLDQMTALWNSVFAQPYTPPDNVIGIDKAKLRRSKKQPEASV